MKSLVAAIGFLAAAASAKSHPRHLHFRRANETAPADQTTLTVIATEVHTITSCAPTVTDCPADKSAIASLPESQKTVVYVTETVVLATTVCPVAEASSIKDSIISASASSALPAATSSPESRTTAIQPTIPLTTGGPAATSNAQAITLPPGLTTSVTTVVSSKTLTLTLGTGSSASVVTTTIVSTVKQTITVPSSQTDSGSQPTGPAGDEVEPTTTVTSTATITRTITLAKASPTNGAGVPGTEGSQPIADKCQCPAAATVTVTPAAVTVTVPASTVYVTVSADAIKTAKQPSATDSEDRGSDKEDNTSLQPTVTHVPYPVGNGTTAYGAPGSSGFARLHR